MASAEDAANTEVLEMMRNLMTKVDAMSERFTDVERSLQKVDSLEARMSRLEKHVDFIAHHLSDNASSKSVAAVMEQASQNVASLVCFNNTYHMVFYGIPPVPDISVDEVFRSFLVHMLHFDEREANTMPMRVFQLAKRYPGEAKPPICVSFSHPGYASEVKEKSKKFKNSLMEKGITAQWAKDLGNGALGIRGLAK